MKRMTQKHPNWIRKIHKNVEVTAANIENCHIDTVDACGCVNDNSAQKIGLCKSKKQPIQRFCRWRKHLSIILVIVCLKLYDTLTRNRIIIWFLARVENISTEMRSTLFWVYARKFIFCHAERYLDVMRLKIEALRCRKKMERPVETTSKKMSNKQAKLLAMEIINALKSRTSRIRSGNRGADFIMRYV